MAIRPSLRVALLNSTARILKPVVSFLIRCGINYRDFQEVAKQVFVEVASSEYGLRGRPTNISRVAVLTGLSRKEISKLRQVGGRSRWSPDMKSSAVNTILHYWHYDPRFSVSSGSPRSLPFAGENSFSELVREYGGDLPPGAIRTELRRAHAIEQTHDGLLAVRRRFYQPAELDEDLISGIAFSLANLANTVTYNASVLMSETDADRRFERYAWTEHLPDSELQALCEKVNEGGSRLLEEIDDWLGCHELPREKWSESLRCAIGIGVYFFREDS